MQISQVQSLAWTLDIALGIDQQPLCMQCNKNYADHEKGLGMGVQGELLLLSIAFLQSCKVSGMRILLIMDLDTVSLHKLFKFVLQWPCYEQYTCGLASCLAIPSLRESTAKAF